MGKACEFRNSPLIVLWKRSRLDQFQLAVIKYDRGTLLSKIHGHEQSSFLVSAEDGSFKAGEDAAPDAD